MPPAKNRNHWFQVIVGDEERMFRGVGVQAEGLFAKLRRIAFDCQPIGFLVNHTHHAHDAEYLADCVHLPNGQYRATLRDSAIARSFRPSPSIEQALPKAPEPIKKRRRCSRYSTPLWPVFPRHLRTRCW